MSNNWWQQKPLQAMNRGEWEKLCDHCGKCCLHKLQDAVTGKVEYTCVACKLFVEENCSCADYSNRLQRVPDCVKLDAGSLGEADWLPVSCAYRLLANGEALPAWHPLVTGDPMSTINSGNSVKGRIVHEDHVHPDSLEEYVVQWVDLPGHGSG